MRRVDEKCDTPCPCERSTHQPLGRARGPGHRSLERDRPGHHSTPRGRSRNEARDLCSSRGSTRGAARRDPHPTSRRRDRTYPATCGRGRDLVDVAGIRERFGGVDVLINSAGSARSSTDQRRDQALAEMIEVNVLALCICTREAICDMRMRGDRLGYGGQVIHVASMAAYRIPPGAAVYSATKFAVRSLTRACARAARARQRHPASAQSARASPRPGLPRSSPMAIRNVPARPTRATRTAAGGRRQHCRAHARARRTCKSTMCSCARLDSQLAPVRDHEVGKPTLVQVQPREPTGPRDRSAATPSGSVRCSLVLAWRCAATLEGDHEQASRARGAARHRDLDAKSGFDPCPRGRAWSAARAA